MGKFKVIFNQSLMISTAILLGLGVESAVNYFAGNETTLTWQWYIPISIVLAGFLCALPSLAIMLSEKSGEGKLWLSKIFHFISVWLILTVIGYLFGWYNDLADYGIITLMYVIIYAFVWLYTWWMYMKEDKKINEKIKDFQDEE